MCSVMISRLLVISVWDEKLHSAYYQGAKSNVSYSIGVVFWMALRSYGAKNEEEITCW